MKTHSHLKSVLLFFIVYYPFLSFSQWNQTIQSTFRFAQTDQLGPANGHIKSVGIGNFSGNGVQPLSALHINTNFLTTSSGFLPGEVFRTTSNATGANFNAWRMFTGAGAGTEAFSLRNPAGTSNCILQASQPTGNMRFNTGGANTRVFIADGGVTASDGFMGIGNNLPNTFNPTARLHLHQNVISNNFLRFSHAGTNSTATDGLQIGIDNAGNAQFIQNESHLPFQFWINSTPFGGTPRTWERMTITANNFQVNQWNTGSRSISTDITRVGIWLNGSDPTLSSEPVTMLQVGEPLNTAINFGGGLRDWMNVGTYYNQESDNMYVGLRVYSNNSGDAMDKSDAIINWGNNPQIGGPAGILSDRLRFVFTAEPNNTASGQAHEYDGFEVARMITTVPTSSVIISRMGSGGDPIVNPYSAGSANIGNNTNTLTSDPQNTLEINSPAPAFAPALATIHSDISNAV